MTERGGNISERVSVDWEFFHGHCVSAEADRCKWTVEPAVVRFV